MRERPRKQVAKRLFGSLLAITFTTSCAASSIEVLPGAHSLGDALAAASVGDTLNLAAGMYYGPVTIDKTVSLRGSAGTVIDGRGRGNVMVIDAPDVVVRHLTIRNSGTDLSAENSGIFITENGDRAVVDGNRFEHNLMGVNLKGPDAVVISNNDIQGRRDMRLNERGNGVHLWRTPGSVVIGNRISGGRDGIFVTISNNNKFLGNELRDLRFAVHYMYTNHSEVSGNTSRGNHIGYALMYSSHLAVKGNRSAGDRDHGVLFNFTNYSEITDNTVLGHPEKCVFIYNSNYNRLRDNHFEGCEIGVHFTAGSEQNTIWKNAFIDNRTQVKYVGTRHLEWSHDGQGNYWSDHAAFDLNGDNISDRPYRPNNLTDQIMWRHPLSKILLNSPVLQLLNWLQFGFPGLYPGGVVDSAPLMSPKP